MLTAFFLKYRRIVVLGINLLLIIIANLSAYLLRFELAVPAEYFNLIGFTLPVILGIRIITFHFFGINAGLWRYVSVRDLSQIIKGVVLSSAITGLAFYPIMGLYLYPRSVLILDCILLIGYMSGIRLITRLIREKNRFSLMDRKPVLVYGAGDAGELLVRDMLKNPVYNYLPVGFIDDDEKKAGLGIHSVPVLGTGKDLNNIIKKVSPSEIIIAIPSAKPAQMRTIMNKCKKHDISLKTLPSMKDVISGHISVNQIRNISVEDLLFREPVRVNSENIKDLVCGKRVLVTGAAGSIGSELCRQILKNNPRHLVLYDRNENGLYQIDLELGLKHSRDFFSAVIGDICDVNRLYMKFKKYQPEIVFHAAAYKHVPLMEDNVVESVKNNILGTWNLVEMVDQFGVETFVQISTDKAVNPTSMMGVSKRIAEMIVRHINRKSDTRFIVVRFGNVLGSNGSVVPLFKEQIRKGGPITVTHPDIERFFMTIPEAVQLVLQAAYIGNGGEVFVLDMGEPVKIVDLAKNLITLSGLVPGKDIKIAFSGLRPGEKLFEELFEKDEKMLNTSHKKIFMATPNYDEMDSKRFFSKLIDLKIHALGGNKELIIERIKDIVPTYQQTCINHYTNGDYTKVVDEGPLDSIDLSEN
ncbi:MAG: polysaccharide biosynthesis protein [Nitrospirae bacterium]|nr:polysaccharide biosynthesis protein [Nitrospirota bacterium]